MKTKSHLEALSKGRNFFHPKLHKQSTSLNMESQLNNSLLSRIIKTDNKVENYYFNNINISSDQFRQGIASNIGMSIDSCKNKLLNSYAPTCSDFSMGNSVNSLKNISSVSNSMATTTNKKEHVGSVSPFTADLHAKNVYNTNFPTKTKLDHDMCKIKKKPLNPPGNVMENIYKKTDNQNTTNKVGEILKKFKITNKNNIPAETHVLTTDKNGKGLETNLSVNISPYKQNKRMHKNSVSIRVGDNINKLAGDDMDFFFSGNEEEN